MPLSSNNRIDQKIIQTKQEIDKVIELDDSSIIKGLMLSELDLRLSQLEKEREQIVISEAKEIIKLRIYGEKIETGKISNRIFLSILGGFQSMADIMADFVARSTISENGKINKELKNVVSNLTDFQIVDTFAGSFGVVLEKDYGQIGMNTNATKENQVLDDLFSVIENSQDVSCLIDTIVPYGKRAVQHYKNWIESIKENDINIELNWIDSSAASRKVNVKSDMANNIISNLSSIDIVEDTDKDIVGILTGVNIRKKSFEINVENIGVIKGRSSIETLISVSNYLGSRVVANLTKSKICSRDNIETVNWYLRDAQIFEDQEDKQES